MKAVIIDDEVDSHIALGEKLRLQHPQIQVIGSGYNVAEGKELITNLQPELVFLDIDMPDGTGFDLVQSIPQRDFHLIFVTGFNQFAQTAIRLGALDYLQKPVDSKELSDAILKAELQQVKQVQLLQMQILQETLNKLQEQTLPKRMSISTLEGTLFFPLERILFLEADQNYTIFRLDNPPKKYVASIHLKKYESDLSPFAHFVRIHRSYIVNLYKVIRNEGTELELEDGTLLPIAKSKRKLVASRMQDLSLS